jgi:dTDP-4-dehydrorhamnose reductase
MDESLKILVTGCRGQLGMDLMAYLSDNHQVAGISRMEVSITNRAGVLSMFKAVRPDWVIHTAALTDVDECEGKPGLAMAVNADGTENVARACKEIGAKLLYFSTNYVFDGVKGSPYVEEDMPNPLTAYGRSKQSGEERVRSLLDDYVILRIGWVYGSYGHNFVKTIVKLGMEQIRDREAGRSIHSLQVVSDQIGNPTWTIDIARQTEAILQSGLFGLFHVAAEGETNWFDFTQMIFNSLEMKVICDPCTTDQFGQPAPRPRYSALANRRCTEAGINRMSNYRAAVEEFLKIHRESLCG